MLIRTRAIAALALVCFTGPALAQQTPAEDPPAAPETIPGAVVPPTAETPPANCTARRKGPGLGALLAAANQAGAGDLLTGRSGAMFGGAGGKRSIAGAVLGTAINAAGTQDPAGGAGVQPAPGVFGSRKAQAAAVATGAVIGLARSQATSSQASSGAAGCGGH